MMMHPIIALDFKEESVGRTMGASKRRYTWKYHATLEKKDHVVVMTNSVVSGKKKIFFDGVLQHEQQVFMNAHFYYSWPVGNHLLSVVPHEDRFTFTVDGITFEQIRRANSRRMQQASKADQLGARTSGVYAQARIPHTSSTLTQSSKRGPSPPLPRGAASSAYATSAGRDARSGNLHQNMASSSRSPSDEMAFRSRMSYDELLNGQTYEQKRIEQAKAADVRARKAAARGTGGGAGASSASSASRPRTSPSLYANEEPWHDKNMMNDAWEENNVENAQREEYEEIKRKVSEFEAKEAAKLAQKFDLSDRLGRHKSTTSSAMAYKVEEKEPKKHKKEHKRKRESRTSRDSDKDAKSSHAASSVPLAGEPADVERAELGSLLDDFEPEILNALEPTEFLAVFSESPPKSELGQQLPSSPLARTSVDSTPHNIGLDTFATLAPNDHTRASTAATVQATGALDDEHLLSELTADFPPPARVSTTSNPPVLARVSTTSNPPLLARVSTTSNDPLSPARLSTVSNDPLPPARLSTVSNNPLPPTRVSTVSNNPLPPTCVSMASNDPLPPTRVSMASNDPLSPTRVSMASNDPLPPTRVSMAFNDPLPPTRVSMASNTPLLARPSTASASAPSTRISGPCSVMTAESMQEIAMPTVYGSWVPAHDPALVFVTAENVFPVEQQPAGTEKFGTTLMASRASEEMRNAEGGGTVGTARTSSVLSAHDAMQDASPAFKAPQHAPAPSLTPLPAINSVSSSWWPADWPETISSAVHPSSALDAFPSHADPSTDGNVHASSGPETTSPPSDGPAPTFIADFGSEVHPADALNVSSSHVGAPTDGTYVIPCNARVRSGSETTPSRSGNRPAPTFNADIASEVHPACAPNASLSHVGAPTDGTYVIPSNARVRSGSETTPSRPGNGPTPTFIADIASEVHPAGAPNASSSHVGAPTGGTYVTPVNVHVSSGSETTPSRPGNGLAPTSVTEFPSEMREGQPIPQRQSAENVLSPASSRAVPSASDFSAMESASTVVHQLEVVSELVEVAPPRMASLASSAEQLQLLTTVSQESVQSGAPLPPPAQGYPQPLHPGPELSAVYQATFSPQGTVPPQQASPSPGYLQPAIFSQGSVPPQQVSPLPGYLQPTIFPQGSVPPQQVSPLHGYLQPAFFPQESVPPQQASPPPGYLQPAVFPQGSVPPQHVYPQPNMSPHGTVLLQQSSPQSGFLQSQQHFAPLAHPHTQHPFYYAPPPPILASQFPAPTSNLSPAAPSFPDRRTSQNSTVSASQESSTPSPVLPFPPNPYGGPPPQLPAGYAYGFPYGYPYPYPAPLPPAAAGPAGPAGPAPYPYPPPPMPGAPLPPAAAGAAGPAPYPYPPPPMPGAPLSPAAAGVAGPASYPYPLPPIPGAPPAAAGAAGAAAPYPYPPPSMPGAPLPPAAAGAAGAAAPYPYPPPHIPGAAMYPGYPYPLEQQQPDAPVPEAPGADDAHRYTGGNQLGAPVEVPPPILAPPHAA